MMNTISPFSLFALYWFKGVLSVFLLLLSSTTISAEARYALVIGNSDYSISPLKNPVNDAMAMAKQLRSLDFEVDLHTNADFRTMISAVNRLGGKIKKGGVGLFYYAGHGVQLHGENYLIPTNARISRTSEVEFEAVALGRMMQQMGAARNGLNIVILDACRNNPFTADSRSAQRGLVRTQGPKGAIIAYATAPGEVAADGNGENGLFTSHLLKALRQPGLNVEQTFKRVLQGVDRESGGQQTPWLSSSFVGEFFFDPMAGTQSGDIYVAEGNLGLPLQDQEEISSWQQAEEERSRRGYSDYLQNYSKGFFTDLAKLRLQQIEQGRIPALARLQIRSNPRSAKVMVNDISYGRVERISLESGRYRIELIKDGYQMDKIEITLSPGEDRLIERSLVPNESTYRKEEPQMEEMVAGCFRMQLPGSSGMRLGEFKQQCLQPFAISRLEITNQQFQMFRPAHKSGQHRGELLSGAKQPVVMVNLEDVTAYTRWLSRISGKKYRLPTESEWRYAAYWEGRDVTPSDGENLCMRANINSRKIMEEIDCIDTFSVSTPVGYFSATSTKLYDLIGNVSEWTCSLFTGQFNGQESRCAQKQDAPFTVVGSSWRSRIDSEPEVLLPRTGSYPERRLPDLGFRVVHEIE